MFKNSQPRSLSWPRRSNGSLLKSTVSSTVEVDSALDRRGARRRSRSGRSGLQEHLTVDQQLKSHEDFD